MSNVMSNVDVASKNSLNYCERELVLCLMFGCGLRKVCWLYDVFWLVQNAL